MLKQENTQLSSKERYIATRNVTLVGALGNILMTIFKLIFGIYGQSQALIADGLHSLSDLISDSVVLVAAKYSSLDADADHPYGHGRFETLATVIIGALLILVAAGMLIDAGRRLLEPELLWHPTGITLIIVALSILLKEALYQYTIYIAKQVRSQILRANAWHHRSDAISSVIVFVGIAGSLVGIHWLDAVAAIGVSFMIAQIGWSLGWGAVRDLVDTGLDKNQVNQIKKIIKSVDGVQTLHELRTRKMGADALVDVHIMVNPRISVSEGHQIGEMVRTRLTHEIEDVTDVLVHIDPEDDRNSNSNLNLPLRHEIISRLQTCWQSLEASHAIEQFTLHYLSGKVTVDIYLPLSIAPELKEAQTLSQRFKDLGAS
ncbi:MAG: cation transporter, partial [Gammaproteobacteria bacterium]